MAEAFTVHDHAARIAAFLDRHPRTLVLTGAGLSTASGIPDYRDRDGTRRGKPPSSPALSPKWAAIRI